MRFYRVHIYDPCDGSQGFEWATSKRDALFRFNQWRGMFEKDPEDLADPEEFIDVVDIEPTKRGILAALKVWAYHPDNG